uniref:Secreted protein n=1 Tax=Anguilla anguilla TaxID=7936 RepID=A0A0E9S8U6_ANGAN
MARFFTLITVSVLLRRRAVTLQRASCEATNVRILPLLDQLLLALERGRAGFSSSLSPKRN